MRDGIPRPPKSADDWFREQYEGPTPGSMPTKTAEITVGPLAPGNNVVARSSVRGERFFTTPKTAAHEPETHPGAPLPVTTQNSGAPSQSLRGMDVETMPPATGIGPHSSTSAPGTGKKGPAPVPAPTAKAVSNQILATLKGKRGKVPSSPVPQAPASAGAEPEKPKAKEPDAGRDMNRVAMPAKTAAVLRAVGVPPQLVSEDSVLFAAVTEKIAAVSAVDVDDSVYVTRDDWHPFAIWTKLASRFGDEWLGWDTETIQETLRQETGAEPSPVTMNKIAALKLVSSKPQEFGADWQVFEKVCLAFDGQSPRISLIEDLTPEQMAMGLSSVRMITAAPITFTPELQKYCAARLFDAGFVLAPPELGFCDAELQKMIPIESANLRKAAMALYGDALQGKEPKDVDETPEIIQAGRVLRVHAYVLDRVDDVIRQLQ
jgi:hypothetical protein